MERLIAVDTTQPIQPRFRRILNVTRCDAAGSKLSTYCGREERRKLMAYFPKIASPAFSKLHLIWQRFLVRRQASLYPPSSFRCSYKTLWVCQVRERYADENVTLIIFIMLMGLIFWSSPRLTRVPGGLLTYPGEFPHIVSVQLGRSKKDKFHGKHGCSATLLSSTAVITAAHCCTLFPPFKTVSKFTVLFKLEQKI